MHPPYSPNGEAKGYEWSFPTTWSFVFGEVLFFHVLLLFPNLSCDFTGQLWVFSCHLAQWFYLLRWWLLRDCTNQRGANQQRVVLLPKRKWFSMIFQAATRGRHWLLSPSNDRWSGRPRGHQTTPRRTGVPLTNAYLAICHHLYKNHYNNYSNSNHYDYISLCMIIHHHLPSYHYILYL